MVGKLRMISTEIQKEIQNQYEDLALTFAMGDDLEESAAEINTKYSSLIPLIKENIEHDEIKSLIISLKGMIDSFIENSAKNPDNKSALIQLEKVAKEVSDVMSAHNIAAPTPQVEPIDTLEEESENITKLGDEELDIYREFVGESLEHLESIEESILQLEEEPHNIELINAVFRPFHSMKGSAGFIGLTEINMLAHETENLLDKARKNKLVIRKNTVDVLLNAIDVLKQLVEHTETCIGQNTFPTKAPNIDTREIIYRVKEIIETENNSKQNIGEILLEEGVIDPSDLDKAVEQQKMRLGEILVQNNAASEKDIDRALNVQKAQGIRKSGAIKVDIEKLDSLMELVGELIISHTLVSQNPVMQNPICRDISKELSNLGKISNGLQEMIMLVRMVPLKQTFQKMNRLVRDLCQKTGKQTALIISGENTEIDKTVIDKINDPLVHLVRNSMDHGIEKAEERKKRNKPENGTIHLSAFHRGGEVVIEIKDDGRGISKEKVFKKALDKGMAIKGENYSDSQIMNFIFNPGFSTVEKATDISGRGVGMDVVKKNIEQLGGIIDIKSEENVGTTFTVFLPLTTAIVDGMVVQVDNEKYIIPTIAIRETISPSEKDISTVRNSAGVIKLRNEIIPIIRLHEVLNTGTSGRNPWDSLIVVVECEGKKFGLLVDDLLGQQQVVIKTLGKKLKDIKGVAGAAILGDGKVGLILDVLGLISLS